jgi:hypothetical protein
MRLNKTLSFVLIASSLTLMAACTESSEVNATADVDAINRAIDSFHHLNDKTECPSVQKLIDDGFLSTSEYHATVLKGQVSNYVTEETDEGECIASVVG